MTGEKEYREDAAAEAAPEKKLNHFDRRGNAIMVDVSAKEPTARTAVAKGRIRFNRAVLEAIVNYGAAKGDVLGVARVAGIMATKRTAELIPMCHPLNISHVSLDFAVDEENSQAEAVCTVKVGGKTGVEMEALTGVSVALLTIYDMCKALDKGMELFDIHLVRKEGGKSGEYRNERERD